MENFTRSLFVAFSAAAAIFATPLFANAELAPTPVTALAKLALVTRSVTAEPAEAATAEALSSALPSHQRFSIFEAWSAVTAKPAMIGSPNATSTLLGVPAGRAKLFVVRLNVPAASIWTSGTLIDLTFSPRISPEQSVEKAPRKLSWAGSSLRIFRE